MTPWRDTWHPSDPERVCYGCGAKPDHRFSDGSPGYPMTCSHPPETATPEQIARWEQAPQEPKASLDTRWKAARDAGIPQGWVDEAGDAISDASEELVARLLGVKRLHVKGKRDPGWDMVTTKGHTVDVKWCRQPELRVKAWKPRKAEMYVLVVGQGLDDLVVMGWAWRSEVEAAPVKDQGYTNPDGTHQTYYALPADGLRQFPRELYEKAGL